MQRVTGTITGIAPILFSRFYQDPEGSGGKHTPEQRKQEALMRCHRDERGAYIPRDMFKQAILGGAKAGSVKNGRASYASTFEAILFGTSHLYLGQDTYDEILEHWGRVPPKTGGAVTLRYPQFNTGWKADFSVILTMGDKNTVAALKRSIEAAGLLVGMGSWRPEYGRFVLADDTWRVEEKTT